MRLKDIRILDLSRLLPGPYATQLLADLGAEVIKIEEPELGDYARSTGSTETPSGVSPMFDVINRGKKSMSLNLKSERGQDLFFRLAEDADVILEQFRPGVVERLDIDYESIHEHNSDIIYCSLSGYGQRGPFRDRVGHDLNYIGYGGLLDMTRSGESEKPTIPGFPVADMAGGVFAAFSIVSALLDRELNSGGGEYIDISLTDVILSLSQPVAGEAMCGEEPRPGDTDMTGEFACYNVYETADGRFVTLAAVEPKFWKRFCEAVDLEEHIDNHLAEDPEIRKDVIDAVETKFEEKSQAKWEQELGGQDVMFGEVKTLSEAIDHPMFESREIIEEHQDILSRVRFPAKTKSGFDRIETPVPDLGEDTGELLESIGLSSEEILQLRESNII